MKTANEQNYVVVEYTVENCPPTLLAFFIKHYLGSK